MNVERLQHLVQTMKDVAKRDVEQEHKHFYMGDWIGQYDPENPCGTVACAWGWEATTEYAKKQGVVVRNKYEQEITFNDYCNMEAAMQYFEIGEKVASTLFLPVSYRYVTHAITPLHVVTRVEYLLKIGEEAFENECTNVGRRSMPGGSEDISNAEA